MVDAVVLWVDGDDPAHKAKREKYMLSASTNKAAIDPTRFTSVGEEYYCLMLIRKNMPWINRIFLITDNQRPKWITNEIERKLNLHIIDHQEIFGLYRSFLPTFSSRSIVSLIHRIPNLDEKFILFDDDFFVIKRMSEADYFLDDIPKMRGYLIPANKTLARLYLNLPGRRKLIYGVSAPRLGTEPIRKQVWRIILLAHAPYPINRIDYERLIGKEERVERNARFRFRDSEQFVPAQLYANLCYQENRVMVVPADLAYCPNPQVSYMSTPDDIKKEINKRSANHLCIQSLDQYDGEALEDMHSFLSEILEVHHEEQFHTSK